MRLYIAIAIVGEIEVDAPPDPDDVVRRMPAYDEPIEWAAKMLGAEINRAGMGMRMIEPGVLKESSKVWGGGEREVLGILAVQGAVAAADRAEKGDLRVRAEVRGEEDKDEDEDE